MNATLLGPFSQLVTLRNLPTEGPIADESLEIISDGAVLVENGLIQQVGVWSEMRGAAKERTPSQPCVALPAFIDCHTHICWGGSRAADYARRLSGATYQEIAAAGGGIMDTVRQTRAATQDELQKVVEKHVKQLYMGGVATAEVKSGYGLTVEDELKMLRAIAAASGPVDLIPTCLAAHIPPPEAASPEAYLAEVLEKLLPIVKKEHLANRVDIFVEENAFSVDVARPYLEQAKALGFTLTIHADQFSPGGARLAAEMGALSAEHLEASGPEDLAALKAAGVIPVVLPGASLGLGLPFAPARAALDAGLPLAIASDWNPGSAPQGDLLTQAALLGAAEHLTMAETLAGITTRAAAALQLTDRGTVEVGKKISLALFPTTDYREILYYQGSMRPQEVWS